MSARRIAWLGIATPHHGEMARFLRDALDLQIVFEHDTTAELSLTGGDRVQVFGPGHPYYELFREHARGPVPLFEVDDVERARAALLEAGVRLLGGVESDDEWAWIDFVGPDGNLYEVASRRRRE